MVSTSPTYTWDADGNMLTSPTITTLVYNAKNQTVSRTLGGNTQTLTYADADQTERVTEGNVTEAWSPLGLAEETDSYGSTYFTRDPQGNPIGQNHAGGDFYFLTHALGSIDVVFNNTGAVTRSYTYDPFGNLTDNGGTTGSDLKYTGAYWDSQTGNPGSPPLYHIGTRYYDPTTARWTQQDPIAGTIDNPSTLNPYNYAGDDPIDNIDIDGLSWCTSLFGGHVCHVAHRVAKVVAGAGLAVGGVAALGGAVALEIACTGAEGPLGTVECIPAASGISLIGISAIYVGVQEIRTR